MKILNDFYAKQGIERVGFVLDNNKIIEVPNICPEPEEGFMVRTEDIIKYGDVAVALWHTHPNQSSNLSEEDYVGIKNWPNMKHYIIGSDGISCYAYDKEKKVVVKTDG